ncbi:MAG: type II toxin-antitoxin system HicA family toxin [Betaproteobacteria bacterium]
MAGQQQTQRLALWQPIRVEQVGAPDCFAIDVAADDSDVGPFIAAGHVDVGRAHGHPKANKIARGFEAIGVTSLNWLLGDALRAMGAFKAQPGQDPLRVFCRQAVVLPGGQRFGLRCALTPAPDDQQPLPAASMAAVQQAVAEHQAAQAQHTMAAVRRKAAENQRLAELPPDQRAALEDLQAKFPPNEPQPPLLDLTTLVADFPPGLLVKVSSDDPDVVERAAQRAIQQTPDERNPPPREGWYLAAVATRNPKRATAFVTWLPHRGLPAYPEVRAAVERRLPRAFRKPRLSGAQPPDIIGSMLGSGAGDLVTTLFDPSDLSGLDEDDFSFGLDSPRDVAQAAKGRLREFGFEAIGWYQPHHAYTAESWGIYIDARKLDELACSIAEDLRANGLHRGRNALAAKLSLALVYRHELFHAKVEAALTWSELQALQPKFRPYQDGVYTALKGTDGHLEEALANWAAWVWISLDGVVQQLAGQRTADERQAIERTVKTHLDLSPPGYRRWAQGRQTETWRTLATQMVQGRPQLPSPGFGLPIESMLRENLPFDFNERQDVPCRFVGQGRIAGSLLSAPANLNVPKWQELRRVLQRHFGYELIRGEGKGSHEKFRHPDGRMFPLPRRDPISLTVFKSFLNHFGLSKSDYDQIRQTV